MDTDRYRCIKHQIHANNLMKRRLSLYISNGRGITEQGEIRDSKEGSVRIGR